jgi:hypothetical protein
VVLNNRHYFPTLHSLFVVFFFLSPHLRGCPPEIASRTYANSVCKSPEPSFLFNWKNPGIAEGNCAPKDDDDA